MSETTKNFSELSPEERAALVMRLKRRVHEDTRTETIHRRLDAESYPLSFAQQRLWFLNALDPHSPYTIPATFKLKGQLSVTALERTLSEIVRRHEALRTIFPSVEGQPVQVVARDFTLSMPVYDLRGYADDEREAEIKRLKSESQRAFNLASGPLIRASLIHCQRDEHLLFLTMHHIVSDGWSIGVMLREMAALYEAYVVDAKPTLPELPIQYKDFAVWQREWLAGSELENQLGYWKQQLAGTLPVLELPIDRPRPPVQTYHGKMLTCEIDEELTAALKEFSRREGATLYMTLLAAFKTLLYRHTGQTDILVGTPIANRNRVDIEPLIGFFVNTLVLRSNLDGNPTFRQLLARVKDVTLGAYAHQDTPFEKLVEELQPARDMSRTPLFQVMFVLQNAPLPKVDLSGVTITLLDENTAEAQFELLLDMMERDGKLYCIFEYNTDLFETATVERMLRHYLELLKHIIINAEQRLLDIPLLTEDERQQLVVEWNNTAREVPRDKCAYELFEEQVERRGAAPAVSLPGERLSYAELNSRANRLARYLREHGVKPESRVGIMLDRTREMAVALLGVHKAGGAYVALDPAYPPDRISYMLADAEVEILLTQQHFTNNAPSSDVQIICLDADWPRIMERDDSNLERATLPDNLAYLVYTSGTTGQPKGILITHASLINAIYAFITHHEVTERDRILQFASLSFDVATEEFFSSWLSGGCAVIKGEPVVCAPEEFAEFLENEEVTLVNLPASFWAEWTRAIAGRGCKLPSSLRRVVVGNEKSLPETLAKWQEFIGEQVSWSNAYGPTETTITASNFEPRRSAESTWANAVPIGRPVINAQMYVLDKTQQLTPIGVPGELCIGGAGLARGYHKLPEQTAERFVPNPFSFGGGERMYRTGDLVRYLPDGNLQFIGRIDDQVKIRGFRIELGEIETVLNRHPDVREAVIVARADEEGNNRLIAYIVASAGYEVSSGDLRNYLAEKLPEYMIPSAFVMLDALPLTPNGKIDRRALPEPEFARPELEAAYIAPRSTLEQNIARVWQEALKVEKVGIHDNFFGLGGHSLLMIQVNSKLRELLRRDVSIVDMFKYPTVSALAEHLSHEKVSEEAPSSTASNAGLRLEAMNRQLRQRQQGKRQPR